MPIRNRVHNPFPPHTQVQQHQQVVLRERARQAERPNRHQRGYTNDWAEASRQFLQANPLCKRHLERHRRVAATITDHTIPHKGDMVLFWDQTNWQPLCKTCHDMKTATEDGGFGRPQLTSQPAEEPT